MPRRETYALRWNQVDVRVVRLRQMHMHRFHHRGRGMRAGDGEHFRVRLADDIALGAETAGDDDAAVLSQRFADGVQ